MSTQRRAQDVLDYWFGLRPYTRAGVEQRMRLWFGDSAAPELTPQTDEAIRLRFGPLATEAAQGALAAWESSPRRRLALILLMDQFPRNLFRGRVRAFSQDRTALALTIGGMQLGADAALHAVERIFFYMPLQHSESREVQEESVAAFHRLAEEAPVGMQAIFDSVYEFAKLHRDIIERFGRFPHRNRIIGRETSAEEAAWLQANAGSFGQ